MNPTITRIIASMLAIATVTAGTAWAVSPDVIVYGGVPCGIASAITAAREGANVLLIEPTKHVGGLSTSGINTAESEHMLKWTIGGFADEFYRRLGKHYEDTKALQTYPHKDKRLDTIYFFESSVAEKVYRGMLKEAGVEVRYGAGVDAVMKDGAKITGITLTDGAKFAAKVFVDASYEGDLMARAGVKYAVGRESKAEFGEEAAGIRFDKTPRRARTVDAQGKLLPGISAWAKDLKEGDAHPAPMNYNFRLTVAGFFITAPYQAVMQCRVYFSRWAPDNTGAGFLMTDKGRHGTYIGNVVFADKDHRLAKAYDGDLEGACILGASASNAVGGLENRIPSGGSAGRPALHLAGGGIRLERQTAAPQPAEGELGEVRWVDDGAASALWVKTSTGWKKSQLS